MAKTFFFALALLGYEASAQAYDIQFEGFGSFVAGQVLNDADTPSPVQNTGTILDYDEDLSFTPDSLFALQMFSDLQDGLSATAQFVAEADSEWQPELIWGFFSYRIDEHVKLKAGRSRVPFFLFSDTIDVGYSYPWITPPHDIYILAGIDNIDGLNVEVSHEIADWASKINFVAGNSATTISISGVDTEIRTEEIFDITWTLNRDWLTLQFTVADAKATVDAYSQLIDTFTALQIPLDEQQIDLLTLTNDHTRFWGVGAYIEYHPWIWISEYTAVHIEDAPMQNDRSAWYSTLGYRWNRLTFHVTYSESKSPVSSKTAAVINEQVLPYIGFNQTLTDFTEFAYLTEENVASTTHGLRYDFHSSAALKVEFIHRENKEYNVQPELFLVGVDVVF